MLAALSFPAFFVFLFAVRNLLSEGTEKNSDVFWKKSNEIWKISHVFGETSEIFREMSNVF